MKNKLLLATAIIALASCSENTYLGDENGVNGSGGGITFGGSLPSLTRTDPTDNEKLGNNFVVYGYKTMSNNSKQTVFDNYQVNWGYNTAHTTQSNTANWEYVGYKNLPFGTTTTSGGTLNNEGVGKNASTSTGNTDQTIKYWDLNANYTFFAYSLGEGVTSSGESPTTTWAKATAITESGYSLTGDMAHLGKCYISKKKTVDPKSGNNKETAVQLEFLNFFSKIQLGFYETVPGYAVKDLKFYLVNTASTDNKACLYATTNAIATSGTFAITFNGENPVTTLSNATYTNNVTFTKTGSTLENYASTKENKEPDGYSYLGRASNAATTTEKLSVLPNNTGVVLTLKVDYTLVSVDGTNETIEVRGKTATIPAAYTKWESNYAYTYLFKISDSTGELYPITLDATIVTTETGQQTTITTVDEPSITTYAKGAIDNEYKKSSNIYVVVDKGGAVQTLTVDTNAKLYLVTNNTGEGATQEITEESVANALAHGTKNDNDNPTSWTVTGVGMKSLIVTTTGVPSLTATTEIAAADSPTGVAITVNGAKFTPTAAGTYAFEFISCDKATGTYVKDTTYYSDSTGKSEVDTTGFVEGETDVSSYYVGAPKKYYKVIKVVE